MKFIRRLDKYAIKPNLALGRNEAYYSTFGGLITLMIFSAILYIFIDFSRNMITKADPAIKTSLNFHDTEPSVDLEDLGILMFIYDRTTNKYIRDSTIAYFEVQIIKATELEEGGFEETKVVVELEPCSIERFQPSYLHEYLKRQGIFKSQCIKKEQKHDEDISGGWGESEYDYMNIELRRCSGTSPEGLPCKSQAEIDEIFKNSITGVNIVDAVLHLEDYTGPHRKMIKSLHTFTSNQIHKEYVIDLCLGRIITDSGWLLDSKTEEVFLKVVGEREMSKLLSESETGSAVSFVIQMTSVEHVYDRTYDKLPEVLARAGGILQILLQIGVFLILPYALQNYKEYCANQVYNFEDGDKKNKEGAQTKVGDFDDPFMTNSKGEDQYFTVEKKPIDISVGEKLMNIFSFGKEKTIKMRKVNKAFEKLSAKLDIFYIINKLIELDKLKLLLLDENQLRLIDYIPRPVIKDIDHDEGTKYDFQNLWTRFFEKEVPIAEKSRLAKSAFTEICEKENPSEIDKKLKNLIFDKYKHKSLSSKRLEVITLDQTE